MKNIILLLFMSTFCYSQSDEYIRESSEMIGTWYVNSSSKAELILLENDKGTFGEIDGEKTNILWTFNEENLSVEIYGSETKKILITINDIYRDGNKLNVTIGNGRNHTDDMTRVLTKSYIKTTPPAPKKLAPAMKGVVITEKSMIGKWRSDKGIVYNFMYGKVEIYPLNSQMIDTQTNFKGNGVIWLSAFGVLIKQLQVISKTQTKMVLYDMEEGGKINLTKY